jgi:UDP-N-acetylglucosamine--N-acetylmuramyl-(pentapeptide) pyrophosphoryl-undecaprenol N-acetylglucosamine transferase
MNAPLVVLAAGGTGGHMFPAEALGRELVERGRRVALVTDKRGGAFPVEGVATYRIPAGRSGSGVGAKLKGAVDVARGVLAARRLLKRLDARSVVGFGGYPSLPTMLAASGLGLPTVIHDSNAVLGRANRMLQRRVGAIATAFETVAGLDERARASVVHTGNPVRPQVQSLRRLQYDAPQPGGPIRLLVIGGSQGARILSQVIPIALASLPPEIRLRLRVSQQVRKEDMPAVDRVYEMSGIPVEVANFFQDLPARLGSAHLVICRSGGSTVAELTVAGRPSILVPLAAAIADEQTVNAQELVERGAAWLLPEREFNAPSLTALLRKLLGDPEALARAASEAHALGQPDAASALADLVERIEAGARP